MTKIDELALRAYKESNSFTLRRVVPNNKVDQELEALLHGNYWNVLKTLRDDEDGTTTITCIRASLEDVMHDIKNTLDGPVPELDDYRPLAKPQPGEPTMREWLERIIEQGKINEGFVERDIIDPPVYPAAPHSKIRDSWVHALVLLCEVMHVHLPEDYPEFTDDYNIERVLDMYRDYCNLNRTNSDVEISKRVKFLNAVAELKVDSGKVLDEYVAAVKRYDALCGQHKVYLRRQGEIIKLKELREEESRSMERDIVIFLVEFFTVRGKTSSQNTGTILSAAGLTSIGIGDYSAASNKPLPPVLADFVINKTYEPSGLTLEELDPVARARAELLRQKALTEKAKTANELAKNGKTSGAKPTGIQGEKLEQAKDKTKFQRQLHEAKLQRQRLMNKNLADEQAQKRKQAALEEKDSRQKAELDRERLRNKARAVEAKIHEGAETHKQDLKLSRDEDRAALHASQTKEKDHRLEALARAAATADKAGQKVEQTKGKMNESSKEHDLDMKLKKQEHEQKLRQQEEDHAQRMKALGKKTILSTLYSNERIHGVKQENGFKRKQDEAARTHLDDKHAVEMAILNQKKSFAGGEHVLKMGRLGGEAEEEADDEDAEEESSEKREEDAASVPEKDDTSEDSTKMAVETLQDTVNKQASEIDNVAQENETLNKQLEESEREAEELRKQVEELKAFNAKSEIDEVEKREEARRRELEEQQRIEREYGDDVKMHAEFE